MILQPCHQSCTMSAFLFFPCCAHGENTHTFIASVIQGGCCGDRCWLMSNSSCSFAHRNIFPGPPLTMIGDDVGNVGGGRGRSCGGGGGADMIEVGADGPRQFEDVDPA